MMTRNRALVVGTLTGLFCLAGAPIISPGQVTAYKVGVKEAYVSATDEADDSADCHAKEVDGFARSKMARSMRFSTKEPEGIVQVPGTTIRTFSNREGTWQSLESRGRIDRYRVAYVIGSGTHANGYLISLDNHLFQSPVAYYRSRSAYGLAPGYENKDDPNFTRPIEPGCLFCHAGSFALVSGTLNSYAAQPFPHLAISCTRCHGPVDAHLDHPGRSNIVNPASLDPAARDSICEQCHLKGVARVLNPGKRFNDFVPGQPLERTFTTYRYMMPEGTEPPFNVISHSEQLALSLCKRASGSRLWCGTCHDPHNEPDDPMSYYRARCLGCHANTRFASDHPSQSSNCIGCHMPKKETKDGGHTAFTDHRIQGATPEKPEAEPTGITPWRDPPPDLAKRNLGIASIETGMERGSSLQIVSGYRMLTEIQDWFPQDSEMFRTIGNALFVGSQYEEAAAAFELAARFDLISSSDEASLGSAYAAIGRHELAEVHLKRALSLDPLNLGATEVLIRVYESDGKADEAYVLKRKIRSLVH